ncbi:hypothetical protein NHF46_07990 [Arthrobacter alpinus]|nr:hypothetical protein [Arthrobacter alpinus]
MARAEKTMPGAIGVGTEFQATMRGARHPARVTMTSTKFSQPLSLASVSRMREWTLRARRIFSTEGGQTRLAWSWTLHPRGFLRCIAPAIRAMGKRQEQINWVGLKDYLERPGREP